MAYYTVSIFLSAFLLFQIQPMISKYILPWFGGTPAVWSTSLLFFQVLLTGGYAYAYWLIGKIKGRNQGFVHMTLVGISLAALAVTTMAWNSPITPDASWKPTGVEMPIFQILKILTAAVGIPYFLLATNSTLMQAWFNRDHPERGAYRLYALSNVGSLLALVSYPVLVEPFLTLQSQARLWSLGYTFFAMLAIIGAYQTFKRNQATTPDNEAQDIGEEIDPGFFIKVLWAVLPACASILLLAITNQITQEIAAIPFLWVLPLTIYLLSFILTFDSERWYSRKWFSLGLLITSGLYIWLILERPKIHYLAELAIYSALLFVCCMICHGELVKLRPHPRRLTIFYLMVSIGGALGGIFVNLIAPTIFTAYFELPWGIFFCWVLLTITTFFFKQTDLRPRLYQASVAALAVCTLFVGYSIIRYDQIYYRRTIYETRNYYGILRVKETDRDDENFYAYNLVHGKIYHGYQFINPEIHDVPTAYYTEQSGIGLAFSLHPNRPGHLKVGIIGLGVGTQAAYSQPGDVFRFYEINPAVVDLAQGQGGYFSYLDDAQGEVEVVLGDARLSLELELENGENQEFDLLILDAFSSDSIPMHLITKEAFEIYLAHLKTNGILGIHISNKHLNLESVVAALGKDFDLDYAVIEHEGDEMQSLDSTWVLLSKNTAFINSPHIGLHSIFIEDIPEIRRLWTDDYSNLFSVLKKP